MVPSEDRERLRQMFDRASDWYQRARPDYPPELFDHMIEVTGLRAGAKLLGIGCGPGKATLPLARRGLHVICIEVGPRLAAIARQRLADFAEVEVVEGSFED
jgi:16S rRNA A1518/A1519 N6-dimethyltransferase RsmA/KsgA/DIM1 with predicted DNA glycosylase/AP lyase activity